MEVFLEACGLVERMKRFDLHLVSDSTGETVITMARAAVSQYDGVEAVEHLWSMVRTRHQVEQVIAGVSAHPGIVLFTLVDSDLRRLLENGCRDLRVPTVRVLEPVLSVLGVYLGLESRAEPGRQHALDAGYFGRIDAMQFVLDHDDGQMTDDLHRADVVLVGPSRTSKTPTCFYLANRGIKAANVPIVPEMPLSIDPAKLEGCFVIGLIASADRLVQVRRNRLQLLNEETETNYVDLPSVREEVIAARRTYAANAWPMIDVTRRSIEEVAAAILQLHGRYLGKEDFIDPAETGAPPLSET